MNLGQSRVGHAAKEDATRQRIDSLDIGGSTQWVLLRGDPRSQRVLLVVQQGPGLPLIHEARALERRLVSDVRAMVDALCARLNVDSIDILGFSFGATLATMAAAQNPARIGHVVAVGIDVDFAESERYAHAFACDEAQRRGDRHAERQLQAIGAPPHDTATRFMTRVRWVTAYGGIHRGQGFFGMLWANLSRLLASPHYSMFEAVQALCAIQVTQEQVLAHLKDFDLRAIVSHLDVPVVFFQGRHDFATPPALVAKYVGSLDAPHGKSIVWFEASAHMPQYEEPGLFRQALLRALVHDQGRGVQYDGAEVALAAGGCVG